MWKQIHTVRVFLGEKRAGSPSSLNILNLLCSGCVLCRCGVFVCRTHIKIDYTWLSQAKKLVSRCRQRSGLGLSFELQQSSYFCHHGRKGQQMTLFCMDPVMRKQAAPLVYTAVKLTELFQGQRASVLSILHKPKALALDETTKPFL